MVCHSLFLFTIQFQSWISTGLIGNLKSCSLSMFHLYFILKSQPEGHISQDETDIASGKRPLTAKVGAEFLSGLEMQSKNIKDASTKQQEQAAVRQYHACT